jgi:hypothetical protein
LGDSIDLHVHSTCSDGTFTPEEVVQKAAELGIGAISLTDHDSVDGVPIAQEVGRSAGVEVVPGTELSVVLEGRDLHLLGYFIDPDHRELVDCLRIYQQERRDRAERMVRKLNRMGIRVKLEHVLAKAGSAAVGRPHVADVMVEEEFVFSPDEAFHKYLGYSKPAYEPKYTLTPADGIHVIRAAGGLACLAHPVLYGRDDLVVAMIAEGLDGIEVRHVKHGPAEVARYEEMASQYGLLRTGGSDCHGDGRGESVMGKVEVPGEYLESLRQAYHERRVERA